MTRKPSVTVVRGHKGRQAYVRLIVRDSQGCAIKDLTKAELRMLLRVAVEEVI